LREAVLPAGAVDHVGTLVAQARLARARGRLDEAESLLRRALARATQDKTLREEAELALGDVLAVDGRTAEAAGLLRRAADSLWHGHWLREATLARLRLPPFAAHPTADDVAAARAAAADLRKRLGPDAPVLRQLEAALAVAPPGSG
jgi:tetratricopeptide (TPR) repeat protein